MSLSPSQINVVSVFIEGALYGIFWVFFIAVVYIQIVTRKATTTSRSRTIMFVAAVVMFIDANIHMLFVVIQTVHDGTVTSKFAYIIQLHIVLEDAILIWRVWVVWSISRFRLYVVMTPVIVLALNIAFGIQAVVQAYQGILDTTFILPTSVLTIVNTVLCTGLIIYQIKKSRNQDGALTGVIYLLTETGACCTVAHMTTLILCAIRSPAAIISLRMLIPLSGIIQTWTIIYVYFSARNLKHLETHEQSSSLVFGTPGTCSTVTESSIYTSKSSVSLNSLPSEVRFSSRLGSDDEDVKILTPSCDSIDTMDIAELKNEWIV